MYEGDDHSQINFPLSEIAIIGNSIDDRGKAATEFVESKSKKMIMLDYNPMDSKLELNEEIIDADLLDDYLELFPNANIVLETTTLGLPEIFLCCKALMNLGIKKLDMLYVEPLRYNRPRQWELLQRRNFDLSREFLGFRAIPGAVFLLSDKRPQKGIFFLGYEERRLDAAFEDCQMINPSLSSLIFGVPAFRPGWEMDSFANNLRVIEDKNIRDGIYFCGADNPASAAHRLTQVYDSLEQNEQMFVVPIGTKPNGIGAVLFVATHPDVGILYDHPKRIEGRSEETGKWHHFEVKF